MMPTLKPGTRWAYLSTTSGEPLSCLRLPSFWKRDNDLESARCPLLSNSAEDEVHWEQWCACKQRVLFLTLTLRCLAVLGAISKTDSIVLRYCALTGKNLSWSLPGGSWQVSTSHRRYIFVGLASVKPCPWPVHIPTMDHIYQVHGEASILRLVWRILGQSIPW